uniref:Phosphatidylinositol-3,4,5-trisphosphate 3-phosphatase n=1 Tax=Loa loa TaxID=7209 RepID=A0A1I7V844_LOALO
MSCVEHEVPPGGSSDVPLDGSSSGGSNDSSHRMGAAITEPMAIASTSAGSASFLTMPEMGTLPLASSLPSALCVTSKTSDVICNPWRNLVSQNRRRYKKDNFDLDLTYITDRIIAMGFPAIDQEKIYRNSMKATVAFLERYHADHYMVFNLRGRHAYDPSYFHNRVMTFEMDDHHPPRLELMAPFCRAVHDYLAADEQNVVAVHCKAGKGRTGVMICAYLVYINFYYSPRQNMDYYSIVRTVNNKGVTIPSQRRYVYYFSHLRKRNLNYMPLRCELIGVYFERPPRLNGILLDGAYRLRVANGDVDVFIPGPLRLSGRDFDEEEALWSQYPCSVGEDQFNPYDPQPGKDCISRRCYGWSVPAKKRVFIEGDVRIDFYAKKWFKGLGWTLKDREKLGHVWFNTMFTCPGYCGGVYVHGDEAYPYPKGGTTIFSPWPPLDSRSCETTNGILKNTSQYSDGSNRRRRNEKKPHLKNERPVSHQWNIDSPPGLEKHCPLRCLPLIYPEQLGRQPPRKEIMAMLRDAHIKHLISDKYKMHLQSLPSSNTIPRSPEVRLDCGGPMCLMRRPYEHVLTFSVLEIDRAFKHDKVNKGLKIYVVVRCIDVDNKDDVELAKKCIENMYAAQAKIDVARTEEMRKKNGQSRFESLSDSTSSHSSNSYSADAISDQPWRCDPRLQNTNLRKYFFRQRADSKSVHPPANYRCKPRTANSSSVNLWETDLANHGSDDCLGEEEITMKKQIENADTEYAKDFIATQDREWLEESSESGD